MQSKNTELKSIPGAESRGVALPHSALRPTFSERGSTLVISLIVLIILMLLGIGAMNTSDTQFKMAGNLQFENIALNNAETAVATAEALLADGATYKNPGLILARSAATPQFYPIGTLGSDPLTMSWDDSNSAKLGDSDTEQRYLIENLSNGESLPIGSQCSGCRPNASCNRVNTYRIIARGASKRGAIKFIESYYSVLNC